PRTLPPFPYTTLFRSPRLVQPRLDGAFGDAEQLRHAPQVLAFDDRERDDGSQPIGQPVDGPPDMRLELEREDEVLGARTGRRFGDRKATRLTPVTSGT